MGQSEAQAEAVSEANRWPQIKSSQAANIAVNKRQLQSSWGHMFINVFSKRTREISHRKKRDLNKAKIAS